VLSLLSSILFVVAQQGFVSSSYDSTIFFELLILILLDGMIITSDDTSGIHALQSFLSQNFEMKDLGALSYFFSLVFRVLMVIISLKPNLHLIYFPG
jgi:hypothetical protein